MAAPISNRDLEDLMGPLGESDDADNPMDSLLDMVSPVPTSSDDPVDSLLDMISPAKPTKPAKAVPATPAPAKPVPAKPTSAKPAPAKPAPAKPTSAKPAPTTELTEEDSVKAAGKITLSSIKDHAKKKGMWAGALKPVEIPDLLGAVPAPPPDDDEGSGGEGRRAVRPRALVVDIGRPHTPALLKAMDEIVVNATDHAKGQEKAPPHQRVTKIGITFDRTVGRVSVYNDGPGIPVVRHAEASATEGRDVYTVEVNFAWFLAGTNIDKELTNVKGGINGLGAKIANVHSVFFEVETVDAGTGRYYRQEFRDRLDVTGAPTIASTRGKNDLPRGRRPRTRG